MSRNGSGAYSLPAGSIVTNGTTIEIAQHNTALQDIATDLNTARPVVAGGTGATTASGARTNLGLGTIATQAANSVDIDGGTIDGAVIGGNSAAAGTFTTINATSISFGGSTLQTYSEGTFTPVLADASTGGNTATAAVAVGHYVKIGRHVTISLYLEDIDTTGLTGGNDIFIRGLPFASRNLPASRYASIARTDNIALTGAAGDAYAYLTQAVDYLRLGFNQSGTASDFLTVSAITSGTANLYIDLTYIAEAA